jgi:hypothetical protein
MRRVTVILHEDLYIFMLISRSILLRMRNVSDKIVEKITTHILCPIFSENRAVYKIIWKKSVTDNIPKITDKHSEYVILAAFPQQK